MKSLLAILLSALSVLLFLCPARAQNPSLVQIQTRRSFFYFDPTIRPSTAATTADHDNVSAVYLVKQYAQRLLTLTKDPVYLENYMAHFRNFGLPVYDTIEKLARGDEALWRRILQGRLKIKLYRENEQKDLAFLDKVQPSTTAAILRINADILRSHMAYDPFAVQVLVAETLFSLHDPAHFNDPKLKEDIAILAQNIRRSRNSHWVSFIQDVLVPILVPLFKEDFDHQNSRNSNANHAPIFAYDTEMDFLNPLLLEWSNIGWHIGGIRYSQLVTIPKLFRNEANQDMFLVYEDLFQSYNVYAATNIETPILKVVKADTLSDLPLEKLVRLSHFLELGSKGKVYNYVVKNNGTIEELITIEPEQTGKNVSTIRFFSERNITRVKYTDRQLVFQNNGRFLSIASRTPVQIDGKPLVIAYKNCAQILKAE